MRPDLWLLEDLTGCDEAEELVEPDGVQPRVAPDCPAAASSNEVEESGHERAADTLALSGWIGRHPPQSPASRPARISWPGDERHTPTITLEASKAAKCVPVVSPSKPTSARR